MLATPLLGAAPDSSRAVAPRSDAGAAFAVAVAVGGGGEGEAAIGGGDAAIGGGEAAIGGGGGGGRLLGSDALVPAPTAFATTFTFTTTRRAHPTPWVAVARSRTRRRPRDDTEAIFEQYSDRTYPLGLHVDAFHPIVPSVPLAYNLLLIPFLVVTGAY